MLPIVVPCGVGLDGAYRRMASALRSEGNRAELTFVLALAGSADAALERFFFSRRVI